MREPRNSAVATGGEQRAPAARADRASDTDKLGAVLARVEQLETRVRVLETARRGRHADPVTDGQLLGALAITIGAGVFTARDLRHLSAPEVRAALGAANTRTIGAWLRRLSVHPVPPYRVRRIGRDERGALWTVAVSRD